MSYICAVVFVIMLPAQLVMPYMLFCRAKVMWNTDNSVFNRTSAVLIPVILFAINISIMYALYYSGVRTILTEV